jgi:hypothetical protein
LVTTETLLAHQRDAQKSAKKVEEKFGGFRKILYLCIVNHDRQNAGGGHPMKLVARVI